MQIQFYADESNYLFYESKHERQLSATISHVSHFEEHSNVKKNVFIKIITLTFGNTLILIFKISRNANASFIRTRQFSEL
jgi:hypothetical protein